MTFAETLKSVALINSPGSKVGLVFIVALTSYPTPPPPVILTSGATVYPEPLLVTLISVIFPLLIYAWDTKIYPR